MASVEFNIGEQALSGNFGTTTSCIAMPPIVGCAQKTAAQERFLHSTFPSVSLLLLENPAGNSCPFLRKRANVVALARVTSLVSQSVLPATLDRSDMRCQRLVPG
jgi:hypothetical protein